MSSEINNTLTLSTVIPAKTVTGSQTSPAAQTTGQAKQNDGETNLSLSSVQAATSKTSQLLQASNLTVEYGVDSGTKEMVMKIVDSSGKLVRQIPSAEILDFVKRLQTMEDKQQGAVIQTRA